MAKVDISLMKLLVASAVLLHCLIDVNHFMRHGQVSPWYGGWEPAGDHLETLGVNLALDALACAGVFVLLYQHFGSRKRLG